MIIAWVLFGAVLGGFLVSALGDAFARHPGDIGAIFGGLLIGAPLGALSAGFAGAALSRAYPAGSALRGRFVAATWMMPVIVVLCGWLFEVVRTWDDLLPSGGAASLQYQIALPPGTPALRAEEAVVELYTDKETRKPDFPGHGVYVEHVAGRLVIHGSFGTYKTARQRSIHLRIGDGATYVFELTQLPPRPPRGYAKEFSDWQGAARVEGGDRSARPPAPGETLAIRYQMNVI